MGQERSSIGSHAARAAVSSLWLPILLAAIIRVLVTPGVSAALVGPLPGPNIGDQVLVPMLVSPHAIALLPSGDKALVADGDKLLLLDLTTRAIQVLVGELPAVTRIVIEPGGESALVTQGPIGGAGRLVRIALSTGQISTVTADLQVPRGLAIDPAGRTAVIRDGRIVQVDLTTGAMSVVPTGSVVVGSGGIALEPGGTTALFVWRDCLSGCDPELKRVNLDTGEVSIVPSTLQGRLGSDAIQVSGDGAFALVVVGGGDTGITKVDLATGTTSQVFASGLAAFCSSGIVDLALTGDAADVFFSWFTPGDWQVSRVRLSDRALSTVAYGIRAAAVALQGDGTHALVTSSGFCFGSLYRLDIATSSIELLGPAGMTFGGGIPDVDVVESRAAAVVGGARAGGSGGELFLVDLTSRQATEIGLTSPPVGVAAEASGETALITTLSAAGGAELRRVNLTTGETSVVAQGLPGPGGIALNSTGTLAILGSGDQILQVDVASGAVSMVARVTGPVRFVAMEPGDQSVLAVAENRGLSRIALTTGEVAVILAESSVSGSVSGKAAIEAGGTTALIPTEHSAVLSEGIKRVRIAASGRSAALIATPGAIDFGGVAVGQNWTELLMLENAGSSPLIGSCEITGPYRLPDGGEFTVDADDTLLLRVTFAPTLLGSAAGTVSCGSNGGESVVQLHGDGVAKAPRKARPRIRSVSPGKSAAGDLVTISGSGFGTTGLVVIGASNAEVSSWNDTFVRLVTPNVEPGRYKIQVISEYGTLATTSIVVVRPGPVIEQIQPATGSPGTTVLISGSGFGAQQEQGSHVEIGQVWAEVTRWMDDSVAAKIPALPPGSYQVTVATSHGTASRTLRVRTSIVVLEYGQCDESFLATLSGDCHILVPTVVRESVGLVGTRIQILVKNNRPRWYEVKIVGTGTSPAGQVVTYVQPGGAFTMKLELAGPGANLSFFSDGTTPAALGLHGLDLVLRLLTGHGLSFKQVDIASSIVSETGSRVGGFLIDLGRHLMAGDFTEVLKDIQGLPGRAVNDQIFGAELKRQLRLLGVSETRLTRALRTIKWGTRLVSVIREELLTNISPRFDSAILGACRGNDGDGWPTEAGCR